MILDIIHEIKATSSKNAKIEILKRHKDNELLQRVIHAAYDPYTQYYIRKIPDYTPYTGPVDKALGLPTPLDQALDILDMLSDRKVTGHDARDFLAGQLGDLSPDDAKVIELIIGKSLDCGMTESTANKVWPKLVPTYPCLLAKGYDEKTIAKMSWPAYSQLKADGMRINAHIVGGTVSLCGRSGKPVDLLGELDADLLRLAAVTDHPEENFVYDGELVLVEKDGSVMDRKKGNGILNKAIRGKISQKEAAMVHIRIWDVIGNKAFHSVKDKTPYHVRFEMVKKAIEAADRTGGPGRYSLIETKEVSNLAEAETHFAEMLQRGEEGTLLKSKDHAWEDKRSAGLIKMKAIKDADLVVVDWQEGTGKYAGMLGALVCQSSDGKVEVHVGSGFSDEQRKMFTRKATVGRIVEILYNERISSKDKNRTDVDSLFLPRFIELREDKTVANSSKEIK